MDKTTKAYIDSLINPLLARIQFLQTSNEALKTQVRHLQQLANKQPSYQRPTLSASQHMRQRRMSSTSRESQIKKPSWNNNSKFESPSKPIQNQVSHQKIKTKPPIPKTMKSPTKASNEESRNVSSEKKINGGTKLAADNNQQKQNRQNLKQNVSGTNKKTENAKIASNLEQQTNQPLNTDTLRQLQMTLGNNLVETIKQSNKEQSLNYVQKVGAPKSEYNNSHTASPQCRSFISESDNKKVLDGMKVNVDCGLVKLANN